MSVIQDVEMRIGRRVNPKEWEATKCERGPLLASKIDVNLATFEASQRRCPVLVEWPHGGRRELNLRKRTRKLDWKLADADRNLEDGH